MKKSLVVFVHVIVLGSLLSGCNPIDKFFPQANGIILYGDQQQIESSFKKVKTSLEEDAYSMKIAKVVDQEIVILEEKTAKELVEKGLLKEVINGTDTEPVTSLRELKKHEMVLFAKEKLDEVTLEGKPLKVTYEGNIIIGDARVYGDMFLIVDDADWSAMKGTEKTIGILKYDKDPSVEIGKFGVEREQLVKISE